MEDKILDDLLKLLGQRRPRFGIVRATLRVNKVFMLRGKKWPGMEHKELELTIMLLDQDRTIAKLQKQLKAKAKAKPKAKPKAKKDKELAPL